MGYLDEFIEMFDAGVHTAVAGEAHEVEVLACGLCIFVGALHFGVFHDAAVAAGTVDLDQVLINHTAGTDIEVSYLGVTHLSIGQTHVFAAGLQLRVGIFGVQGVKIGCRRLEDDVGFVVMAVAPAIENHQ